MKVYVKLTWNDEDYEDRSVESVQLSLYRGDWGIDDDVREVKLSLDSLLGFYVNLLNNPKEIDRLISSMQNDDEELRNRAGGINELERTIVKMEVSLEASTKRYDELHKLWVDVKAFNDKLRAENRQLRKEEKIKQTGRKFIGFRDNFGNLWEKTGRHSCKFNGRELPIGIVNDMYGAVPVYENIKQSEPEYTVTIIGYQDLRGNVWEKTSNPNLFEYRDNLATLTELLDRWKAEPVYRVEKNES